MNKKNQQMDRSRRLAHWVLRPSLAASLLAGTLLAGTTGCQTSGVSASRSWFPKLPFRSVATSETETAEPVQVEETPRVASNPVTNAGGTLVSGLPSTNRLVGYVTGKKYEDIPRAKEFYRRGDERFRQAARAPKATRTGMFAEAAELFESAGK